MPRRTSPAPAAASHLAAMAARDPCEPASRDWPRVLVEEQGAAMGSSLSCRRRQGSTTTTSACAQAVIERLARAVPSRAVRLWRRPRSACLPPCFPLAAPSIDNAHSLGADRVSICVCRAYMPCSLGRSNADVKLSFAFRTSRPCRLDSSKKHAMLLVIYDQQHELLMEEI